MNTINLKITGAEKYNPTIMVDGKTFQTKKNKFGSTTATITTEKDSVEVVVSKTLELADKWWWLWAIAYYIVSIFGIFDIKYDTKCVVFDCKFNLKVTENCSFNLAFNKYAEGGKAVEITSDNEVEEIKNNFAIDKKAKNRWKLYFAFKVVSWVALVIGLFVIIF